MRKQAALFWSGGKDSAYALYEINRESDYEIEFLVTTLNSEFKRISMHGVREEMLERQSQSVAIPLYKMWVGNEPTNDAYEKELHKTLNYLKSLGINHVIFGDIFLEDLKIYRDTILSDHGLTGVYPLWKKDTTQQINDFINQGFKTLTCCISTKWLDKSWLGREIDTSFIKDLPGGIDTCGENGEFHTFCFDGPIFRDPIAYQKGEERFVALTVKSTDQEHETGFWYVDLL